LFADTDNESTFSVRDRRNRQGSLVLRKKWWQKL
jgi:hypothetical protein